MGSSIGAAVPRPMVKSAENQGLMFFAGLAQSLRTHFCR
jgi:hypothetical protein